MSRTGDHPNTATPGDDDTADPATALRDAAQEGARDLQTQAGSWVDTSRRRVAGQLARTGDALRVASNQLAEEDAREAAGLLGWVAQGADELGRDLGDRSGEELADGLASVVRANPVGTSLGAAVLGFSLGRLLARPPSGEDPR